MELSASKSNLPISALLTAEFVKEAVPVKVKLGNNTQLSYNGTSLTNSAAICRYLARLAPSVGLYGQTILERTEVDHWLEFSNRLSCAAEFGDAVVYLNKVLGPVTYLVGHGFTLADLAVWGALRANSQWKKTSQGNTVPNVSRYYKFLSAQEKFVAVSKMLPKEASSSAGEKGERKEEGKFVELPGAEDGKVVVRFPPEASGFLHIGHAKAALLNQYYQKTFNGKLIMRFDDTNPAKEDVEFEKVILEDVAMLGLKYDIYSHTSDLFERMLEECEKMIKAGKAYADNTEPELMKQERETRTESKNRSSSVEANLKIWEDMKNGSPAAAGYAIRAKIDMQSDNGCLRDPTIYRCKNEIHPKTGDKYKVYPTYDFACPIVDSLEGVTHALRTTEYHDRDDQFYWFCDAMGLRKPYIWSYSRLNLQNTVLSKRKLTWFVENGVVEGWDDPRFPTVRGVMRRGMTVEGLKQFIISQGGSRSVVMMEWDKIWAVNKKVIDPIVPRYTALMKSEVVPVVVLGAKEEVKQQAAHPKNSDVGMKDVWYGPKVLIDGADAETLREGETVTFINWGNLNIKSIKRNTSGKVESVEATLNLENTDFKKTAKLTWITETEKAPLVPTMCVHFDHIISKAKLEKDEDFKNFVNRDSKHETEMLGDPMLAKLKKGDMIQLQRRGYYICDSPYEPVSRYTGRASPCILFNIPDGHTKEMPKSGSKHKDMSAKEIAQSKKGKKAEKSPQEEQPPSQPGAGDAAEIYRMITDQGNMVRKLKGDKAEKAAIDGAVKALLALKAKYKAVTDQDFKPGQPPAAAAPAPAPAAGNAAADQINDKIAQQGDKIRQLKASKVPKSEVDVEVKVLLALKSEYKSATGKDWKPGAHVPSQPQGGATTQSAAPSGGKGDELNQKITEQGNRVRELKSQKAPKADVDAAVKVLLALKVDYKAASGKDWKPGQHAPATAAAPAAPPAAAAPSGGKADELNQKITEQGNRVRELKSQKAPKADVDAAVKALLALKVDYKAASRKDWKPGQHVPATAATPAAPPAAPPAAAAPSGGKADELNQKITEQGSKIRDLKAAKTPKSEVDVEVKVLLALKSEYKSATGKDWKPGTHVPSQPQGGATTQSAAPSGGNGDELNQKITEQGDKIRQLKSQKVSKSEVDVEVKKLLALKAEYKSATGNDWKPGAHSPQKPAPQPTAAAPPSQSNTNMDAAAQALKDKIDAQGTKVRELKGSGAAKDAVDAEVKALLSLKAQYKELTGEDLPGGGGGRKDKKKDKKADKAKEEKAKAAKAQENAANNGASKEVGKVTRLGMEVGKAENFSQWYSQVITKAEMIEYYDVSGCYILRPWAFAIWETIQRHVDDNLKKMGVQNTYFPMFVSSAALEKEKDHIADFAPEVAWVTKSGQSELAEAIAIRPTSETVMYPSYAKWIKSHRDLPLKLNQWCNVVRWEFKHPQPFLRTREFLWHEGHSAFASYEEAEKEVYEILEMYWYIYEQMLAIPVIRGKKTEKEKFAGGDYTTTVEAYISATGRAIQGATSHHLGQNFSKMFEIVFEDPDTQEKKYVYQNSWAITTRSIGVMVMVHGDDKGLVLPPGVAQIQAVIVPCGITATLAEEERKNLYSKCEELGKALEASGVRIKGDYRDNYSPGWKFNHWELKGVPLRIEVGPRDMKQNQFMTVRRDTGAKETFKEDNAGPSVKKLLDQIQADMFAKATKERDEHLSVVHTFDDFCNKLDKKHLIMAPFCGEGSCEDLIKKDSARDAVVEDGAPAMGAKSLCIPFDQPGVIKPDTKCIHPKCTNKPKYYTLFGRSY